MDYVDAFLLFRAVPWWHRWHRAVSDAVVVGLVVAAVVSTAVAVLAGAPLAGPDGSLTEMWRAAAGAAGSGAAGNSAAGISQGGADLAFSETIRGSSRAQVEGEEQEQEQDEEDEEVRKWREEDYGEHIEYGEHFLEAENDRVSMFDAVDEARLNDPWRAHVGTVAGLRPGVALVLSGNGGLQSAFAEGDLVLLTEHGGKGFSQGFVVNRALPENEADRARAMLREFGSDSFNVARSEQIAGAIQSSERLWLGGGGPLSNDNDAWTHIHTCPGSHGATAVVPPSDSGGVGVGMGGDVLDILLDPGCFVKLVYGFASWRPGQLDSEVSRGVWQVRTASAALVFAQLDAFHE